MSFRADKEVSPYVVAYAAANIHQEAMFAVEAGTEIDAIAGVGVLVEASALPADAAHKIEADLPGKVRLIHGVKVGQDGTVGLPTLSPIGSRGAPPGRLKVEANALVKDDIGADAGVKASLFRTAGRFGARPGGQKRAAAEQGIGLLGRGKLGQAEDSEQRCKDR